MMNCLTAGQNRIHWLVILWIVVMTSTSQLNIELALAFLQLYLMYLLISVSYCFAGCIAPAYLVDLYSPHEVLGAPPLILTRSLLLAPTPNITCQQQAFNLRRPSIGILLHSQSHFSGFLYHLHMALFGCAVVGSASYRPGHFRGIIQIHELMNYTNS